MIFRLNLIPKEEHKTVIDAYNQRDYFTLVEVWIKYRVNPNNTGSCCGIPIVFRWTEKAIKEGVISIA